MNSKIKEKINNRQIANKEIIAILSNMVEQFPDLRFGQILAITELLEYVPDSRPYIHNVDIKDPFNEESVDMLVRMRDKMTNFSKNLETLEE